MRRGDYVRKPDQRAILRRLFCKDVQRRSRDVSAIDRRRQVGFVDQLSARSVDDAHALLHLRDRRRVDHVPRLRAHRRVQRDKITFRQKLIEWHKFHGQLPRRGFADERIVSNDAHIERFRPRRYLAADAAEPNEPQGLPAHFGARRGFFPPALAHGSIKFWELTNKRQ